MFKKIHRIFRPNRAKIRKRFIKDDFAARRSARKYYITWKMAKDKQFNNAKMAM